LSVQTFYNPELVEQLTASGITPRPTRAPAQSFVLDGRRVPARARETVTNVIAVQGNVTITGPRPAVSSSRVLPALPSTTSTTPQTALELVEECDRLRRDNRRLSAEVERLSAEVARLTRSSESPTPEKGSPQDDAETRFSLLELDL